MNNFLLISDWGLIFFYVINLLYGFMFYLNKFIL